MKSFSSGLLLLSLNFLCNVHGFGGRHWGGRPGGGRPGGGRPWGGRPGGGRPGHMDMSQWNETWTSAGLVPDKIDSVPAPAFLGYNNQKIMIGETVKTENMLNRPILKWKPEWGTLYTIAILDFGFPPGIQYGHWIVSNVRNPWSVNMGDEVCMRIATAQMLTIGLCRLWNISLLLDLKGQRMKQLLDKLREHHFMM